MRFESGAVWGDPPGGPSGSRRPPPVPTLTRSSGLLCHVTSLPSPFGVGDLGPGAERFVDALAAAGVGVWQVLPLVPVGEGDSPYASPSTFALNPTLVSPERLVADGFLDAADLADAPDVPADRVDFEAVAPFKETLLDRAFERFEADAPQRAAFDAFCDREAGWLDDYALFMALKADIGGAWYGWPAPLAQRDSAALAEARVEHARAVDRVRFAQFVLDGQWAAVRVAAEAVGVEILGDLPIYVALDSADVWADRALFDLDADGRPTAVAGVPPDYFSATGQRWGNPLYRWDAMRANGFAWWKNRLRRTLALVDRVRLDHFRGFEAYWSVPASSPTAVDGAWVEGPGDALFEAFAHEFGTPLPILAEDLGLITPEVRALMARHGLPGMAVLQFAFGSDASNGYLPHAYQPALAAYTGTHDNDTIAGWWADGASDAETAFATTYLGLDVSEEPVHRAAVRAIWASVADLAIAPVQDVLGLGSEARMNTPGVETGNWGWRMTPAQLEALPVDWLRSITEATGRAAVAPSLAPDLPPLGALVEPDGVRFRVWAPNASAVDVEVVGREPARLDPVGEEGHHEGLVEGIGAGAHYKFRLDGGDAVPDPASRFQPEGVHGPSEVVDPGAFDWTDADWSPPTLKDLVVYELHVGTFSKDGTFDGVRQRLRDLKDLGVTALELMPVADFPGRWNWGYDGAALFAPSRAYGRPDDLRRLVDAAHAEGLAVLLDVVYNHLGPDGAYLAAFGPAFSDRHETPWGAAMNLDGEGSAGLRGFFLDNVRHWLEEYHLDGLRLDATHALVDESETHFLTELNDLVRRLDGPPRLLVAEDHRNLNSLVRSRAAGGTGLDAVWADDLHHIVRHVLAGDDASYYASFAGLGAAELAETLDRGWYYDGRDDRATGDPRGTSAADVGREQCVVCIQNHDQVGNRPTGERLHHQVSPAAYRAASALLLFAPETPMLFQGQEWATASPFLFFTDHGPDLGPLVTAGRKREFADFPGFSGEVPDPQDPEAFQESVLSWDERHLPGHAHTHTLYRRLLALRKSLGDPAEATVEAVGEGALRLTRGPITAVVDLVGGASVEVPASAEVVLSTEDADVAEDPSPPSRVGDTLRFARPGAVIVRTA